MSNSENLDGIYADLSKECLAFIEHHSNNLPPKRRAELAIPLNHYIRVLSTPLNNDDGPALSKALTFVRNHLCSKYKRLVAAKKLYDIKVLLDELVKNEIISSNFIFPSAPRNAEEYNVYKLQKLPKTYLSQIKAEPLSADEEFEQTLSETCTTEIAKRLKEHVYNFKHAKHHRSPLSKFLRQLSKTHLSWNQQPRVIEGELLKFRNSELSKYSRATTYSRFQNVKNAFIVLKDHGLIPNETELPGNLRRDTNTERVRTNNPLLSSTYIYDERKIETFRNTDDFINRLAVQLRSNLDILLQEARRTVWQAYQKFANKDVLIANSQRPEFLKTRDFKVPSLTKVGVRLNPFYKLSPLRHENLLAYFDHFFDQFTGQQPRPKIFDLHLTDEVRAHLALTVAVASAMQVIIIEELGINPYSLYKVKVSTDGRGHEFVQVTDNGSVRIKASKPRARRSRSAHASGTLKELSSIEEHKINAAVCLQMALNMTERCRASTQQNDLWLCKTTQSLVRPKPESFQNEFNQMRDHVALKYPGLKFASLKKIRTSKGVWIYLTSNGNALKTAAYLGNTVKTTLHRYIPPYLSELVYRSKIRSFQNILLFMSVANEQVPEKGFRKASSDRELDLKTAFSYPHMGGRLHQALTSFDESATEEPPIYFCVSLRNIKLALKYLNHGNDEALKHHCRAAIQKIAEGPVIMKQLLRQAEKQLKEAGDI
ncbi:MULTISPECIES: hypothetical protein [unclassified Idiomarina]|jgi:hypothetical protein|uniref:hypothetical protein n=1 Tax=unclassified Idiomarina TaxID=2614829 RepID=UPI00257EA1A8|nr:MULTISPECIES: hypothetical protein [unclassified Idiomarina]|tara:strand:+ start:5170 stop:7305 length:2136 start_codon:yes stop_codon:yes gene_type:complete